MPFGEGTHAPRIFTNVNHSSNGGDSGNISLNGTAGDNNQFNYNLSATTQKGSDDFYSASAGYNSPLAQLSGSLSTNGKGNNQSSFNMSGALVAHQYGVTMSNSLGDTFAIVHAGHGTNAMINDSSNNRLDLWGNGIYSYLMPYDYNRAGVDINHVSSDVSFKSTGKQIVPRKNAIIMVNLPTVYGSALLVNFTTEDGQSIPMGSVVKQNDTTIGMVGQSGQVYLQGINYRLPIQIVLNENMCEFVIEPPNVSDKNIAGFYITNAVCKESK